MKQKAADITYRNGYFWTSTVLFLALSVLGFWVGGYTGVFWTVSKVGLPEGMGAFFHVFIGSITGLAGWLFGVVITLIIDHRLAKKWRGRLGGGKHPALKLTLLSFLTFLVVLFLFLWLSSLFSTN